jgi:hypothetical protein
MRSECCCVVKSSCLSAGVVLNDEIRRLIGVGYNSQLLSHCMHKIHDTGVIVAGHWTCELTVLS